MSNNFKELSGQEQALAVLDIGSHKISCYIIEVFSHAIKNDAFVSPAAIRVLGEGHQQSHGIKSGMVIDMDLAENAIRRAVDAAEKKADRVVDEVVLSVTAGRMRSEITQMKTSVRSGYIVDRHISRLVRSSQKYAGRDKDAVLHLVPLEYQVDAEKGIQNPVGMSGNELTATIHSVIATATPLNNLILCVEGAHLFPKALVVEPYASGLAVLSHKELEEGAVVIDMGAGTTTLAVFQNSKLVHVDAIAMGGNHLTHEISRSFRIEPGQAERMKLFHGSVYASEGSSQVLEHGISSHELSNVLVNGIENQFEIIGKRLQESGNKDLTNMHMVLTGGASQLEGLVPFIQEYTGFSVRLGKPELLSGMDENKLNPELSALVGLALYVDRMKKGKEQLFSQFGSSQSFGYLRTFKRWLQESF